MKGTAYTHVIAKAAAMIAFGAVTGIVAEKTNGDTTSIVILIMIGLIAIVNIIKRLIKR